MDGNDKNTTLISGSDLISRDLSWLNFNHRVLDQARKTERTIFERLKFMAITDSNLDEFFMIRVGSLYNYMDYGKERKDYSGLREKPFKKLLFSEIQKFTAEQKSYYSKELVPLFKENGFSIQRVGDLTEEEQKSTKEYFKKTIFPMLTPMVFDNYHPFPLLMNLHVIFGVVTLTGEKPNKKKLSFIQIPKNLPKFLEIEREDEIVFVPTSDVIKSNLQKLYRNIDIVSITMFRITRNGDFTLDESDDIEANFLEELKHKLKGRRSGRVVRIEAKEGFDPYVIDTIKRRWELEDDNVFQTGNEELIDFTALWQIVGHPEFKDKVPKSPKPVLPVTFPEDGSDDLFEILKSRDVMVHHPYNSFDPVLELLERSVDDPNVLSIKLTVYRLAKNSRVSKALFRAAENGKHVSVMFEVKARFDEENNIKEAQKLQRAGCFVIYGVSSVKTHTKLLLIVRKEGETVTRYVHMSTGNYNESTAKLYTDNGMMTTNEIYARDVSEFFNAITGHSRPKIYTYLLTAPNDMRKQLIALIRAEAVNAKNGLPSGIVLKANSFQDKNVVRELYSASRAGVPIKLIIRGICSLRPGRKKLSESIEVYSIVGDYLEHSRVYYFHNNGDPKVYSGSADVMVRSFDRRIESLYFIKDEKVRAECINLLAYNLKDNANSYRMNEDGSYSIKEADGDPPFNIHKEFYKLKINTVKAAKLF